MKIRKAKLEDLDYIIDCLYKTLEFEKKLNKNINPKWAFKNDFRWEIAQQIIDDDFLVLLWEENWNKIWILTWDNWRRPNFWLYKRFSNLNYIFIEEEFRKRWYAEELSEIFFKWAKKQWSDRVLLNVLDNNDAANKLYIKLWFETQYITLWKDL